MKKKLSLVLAGTSLLATGGGLVVGLAGSASAATSTTYVHVPGTYWSTKAACQSYASNEQKVVANAGFKLTPSPSGAQYTVPSANCHVYARGWTYLTSYQVPAGKSGLSGDVAISSSRVGDRVDAMRPIVHLYEHKYSFSTKAARDSAYANALKVVQAGNTEVYTDYAYTEASGTYTYVVDYFAARDGAVFPYDSFTEKAFGPYDTTSGVVDANKKDVVKGEGTWGSTNQVFDRADPVIMS